MDVWNTNGDIWCRISLDKQPGDLVFDGLLATLTCPLHDRLKNFAVLEQGAVEFGLNGAGGRSAGEVGQTDFL
jgi:hypothetical protein